MRFAVLPGELAVVRLGPAEPLPAWAHGSFASITRTAEELSIVCPAASVPDGVRVEAGWAALKLDGPIPFEQVGVLASILAPLAEAELGVFAVSTFDTDYVLVREERLDDAIAALERAGHRR